MFGLLGRLAGGEPTVSRRLVEVLRTWGEEDSRNGVVREGKIPKHGAEQATGKCRSQMLDFLGQYGIADADAIEVIAARARLDPDRSVYESAVNCLVTLARTHAAALDALLDLFDLRSPDYCELASKVGWMREAALPALPRLIAMVRGKDPDLQLSALEALSPMGSIAAEAGPTIARAAKSRNKKLRVEAVRTLGTLGWKAPEAVSTLTAALTDPERDVRLAAMSALAALGSDTPGVIEGLAGRLEDPDEWLRGQSMLSLRNVKPLTPATLPILLQAMKDSHDWVRWVAVQGLRPFGSERPEVLPALMKAMRSDSHHDVRSKAAQELGHVRPHGAKAVKALRRALKDKHEDVRHNAAISLGWMKELAAAAVPALRELAAKYPKDKAFRKAIERIEAPPKPKKPPSQRSARSS
jgi:HEAT repeat protein